MSYVIVPALKMQIRAHSRVRPLRCCKRIRRRSAQRHTEVSFNAWRIGPGLDRWLWGQRRSILA